MKQVSSSSFLLLFITFILGLWITSYSIIIPNYEKIEKSKNDINVNTILFNIDNRISYIKNTTKDYAQWDDTYAFINGINKEYIHTNFREGSKTLEGLGIDFLIYVAKNNSVAFSFYQLEAIDLNQKIFEKIILKKFENSKKADLITLFEKKPFFITREEIKKTDNTGEFSGYLYSGKLITEEEIISISKVFKSGYLSLIKSKEKEEKLLKSKYLEKITLSTWIEKQKIFNSLNFYSDEFIFTIKTQNDTQILKEGEITTLFYNFLVLILFFILLLIIYKNQKKLEGV